MEEIDFGCVTIDDYNEIYEYAAALWRVKPDYMSDYTGWDEPGEYADELYGSYSALTLEHFISNEFNELLYEFLREYKYVEPSEVIRGYLADDSGGFYMVHGVGYNWVSDDLCGGTADGQQRREFSDWLENRGYYCPSI